MKSLYVASLNEYTGKSSLCLALALQYQADGLRVGYMKPLGTAPIMVGDVETDEDAAMIWEALGLDDPLELASPVLLTSGLVALPLKGPVQSFLPRVQAALKQLSRDKDLMILEGAASFAQGLSLGLAARDVARMTKAKVLLVAAHQDPLPVDRVLLVHEHLQELLIGVLLNMVPAENVEATRQEWAPFLQRQGISLFGVLHKDTLLSSVTVKKIADALNGDVLCGHERLEELVETYMIGAMTADTALRYFQRKPNKAVITGGDRADIQLAALQTSTRCLILTGNLPPTAAVLTRAVEANVPIIAVREDTMATVNLVERAFGRHRIATPHHIDRLVQMARQEIDTQRILDAIPG